MFLREDTFSKNKQANTRYTQIDSSTIDDNVELQLYSDVISVNSVLVSDKIVNNNDRIK